HARSPATARRAPSATRPRAATRSPGRPTPSRTRTRDRAAGVVVAGGPPPAPEASVVPAHAGTASFRPHRAGLDEAVVPGQRLAQQVRRVLAVALAAGAVEVVLQQGPEIGVRAALDDQL